MIEKFKIIKYKCFNDFTLEKLSQVNVISGRNNVGKTALLEAFYLIDKIDTLDFISGTFLLNNLTFIMKNRSITEQTFKYSLHSIYYHVILNNNKNIFFKHKDKYSLNNTEKLKLKNLNQDYSDFLTLTMNNKLELIPIDIIHFNHYQSYSGAYINSSKPTNNTLVELYSQIQIKGLQHKFLKYLQVLDKNIMWIEPKLIKEWIEPHFIQEEMFLCINLENPEHSLLSSELGEATNRFIQILAIILTNKNGMVFIDNIENGLHSSKLYDIWKTIIKIVDKENVQLFVTTHDKESMEALYKASIDSKFNKVTAIELYKDENNKVIPIIVDYENFSLGLEMGEGFR